MMEAGSAWELTPLYYNLEAEGWNGLFINQRRGISFQYSFSDLPQTHRLIGSVGGGVVYKIVVDTMIPAS